MKRPNRSSAERLSRRSWIALDERRAAVGLSPLAALQLLRRCERRFALRMEADSSTRRDSDESLLSWSQRYLGHYFRQTPSQMHNWLSEQFDKLRGRRGQKLNVVGPRGGAKSTVASLAWPLRLALDALEPYIWIVSDTKQQAQNHLENLKGELIDNLALAEGYPDVMGRGPLWRQDCIVLRNGVMIEAISTGQSIRGRRLRASRPSLIICDDLQNDSHMRSARQRELSRNWFHGTLLKAGNGKTNLINLATALHREALAMELHRTPGWYSRIFKAIERWPDQMDLWRSWETIYTNLDNPRAHDDARLFYTVHQDAMDQGAELLWPAEEGLYDLMCMRVESGRSTFEREKQSSPISPELCEWPESYFDDGIWFEQWPAGLQLRTMAIDPSKGQDARLGDYSAIVMLGTDERGMIYVEADLVRRPTPQLVADGVALYQRFRPQAFGVEANQFQDLLAAEFAAEFGRQGICDARPWLITNQVNKLVRIRRLGPLLASRQIRFHQGSAGTRLLVEQLKDFPLADHDDGPDALEMALRLASEMTRPAPTDTLGDRLPLSF